MQRLEVSGAVRPLYGSLGVKGLSIWFLQMVCIDGTNNNIQRYFIPNSELLRLVCCKQLSDCCCELCVFTTRSLSDAISGNLRYVCLATEATQSLRQSLAEAHCSLDISSHGASGQQSTRISGRRTSNMIASGRASLCCVILPHCRQPLCDFHCLSPSSDFMAFVQFVR